MLDSRVGSTQAGDLLAMAGKIRDWVMQAQATFCR